MTCLPTKTADLEFAFIRDPDEEGVIVEMSIKANPEWDGGLSHIVGDFWPKHIPMDEVMENTFEFPQGEDEVKQLLVSAGFEFSQKFQDALDEYAALG